MEMHLTLAITGFCRGLWYLHDFGWGVGCHQSETELNRGSTWLRKPGPF